MFAFFLPPFKLHFWETFKGSWVCAGWPVCFCVNPERLVILSLCCSRGSCRVLPSCDPTSVKIHWRGGPRRSFIDSPWFGSLYFSLQTFSHREASAGSGWSRLAVGRQWKRMLWNRAAGGASGVQILLSGDPHELWSPSILLSTFFFFFTSAKQRERMLPYAKMEFASGYSQLKRSPVFLLW